MKLRNFQSENLVVDYIRFNFKDLKKDKKTDLGNYLFDLGFNSYYTDQKYQNPFREVILIHPRNQYEVDFIENVNSY